MNKVIILCGGSFAYKSIQLLGQEQYIAGIVLASKENDIKHNMAAELEKNNVPFLYIPNAKKLDLLISFIEEIKPSALFSICFPYLLPANILNLLPNRCINFHTGLLPNYRGAMPIFETLRSFETETALSVHLMDEAFDEGNIILKEYIEIDTAETFGSLAHKFSERTALAALNIAQMLEYGSTLPGAPQIIEDATYYSKPTKQDTIIRWQQMHAAEITALVNACNPWNIGADTILDNSPIKITEIFVTENTHNTTPGTILNYDKQQGIEIACVDNESVFATVLHCNKGIVSAKQFVGSENIIGLVFQT
jgi:methionyl-tRNA formyltransferase